MFNNWEIGSIKGVSIRLHWTFVLFVGWLMLGDVLAGVGLVGTVENLVLVSAIFGCVLLHELGHVLTAKHFGVRTYDITLTPIGGVARLEQTPERPLQELLVTLAGPAVNLAIGLGLFGLIGALGILSASTSAGTSFFGSALLLNLLYVNTAMVVFNLIPAFPMDGGRVLRSLLAMRIGVLRATEVAVRVGKFIAVALGILGLFTNLFLVFIAIFVYFGATQELQATRMYYGQRSFFDQVGSVFRGFGSRAPNADPGYGSGVRSAVPPTASGVTSYRSTSGRRRVVISNGEVVVLKSEP